MNNYVYLKVTSYINRFIKKCYEYKISLYQIDYLNDEEIIVKVSLNDYKKIKKLNYYSKIKIIKYEGLKGIKLHLVKYAFSYIMVILSFALMDIITSYIVKIDIIHENTAIRKLIKEELENNGITTFRLAKEFDQLESIKNNIINDNPTKLEWLSITRYGMTYVIRAEERIITNIEKEEGYAHIISNKDALVTKVNHSAGEALVRSGEFVRKGDILISGQLKVYDEVRGNTLATGEVFGNVWYESDIKLPLEYEERVLTGRRRFNISINNRIFFRNKYQFFKQTRTRSINILGFRITTYFEEEYELKIKKHTLKEAEELAIKKIEEAILKRIGSLGNIVDTKILKKEEINSTMNMRVFIVVNQLISERLFYTPESNDEEN